MLLYFYVIGLSLGCLRSAHPQSLCPFRLTSLPQLLLPPLLTCWHCRRYSHPMLLDAQPIFVLCSFLIPQHFVGSRFIQFQLLTSIHLIYLMTKISHRQIYCRSLSHLDPLDEPLLIIWQAYDILLL